MDHGDTGTGSPKAIEYWSRVFCTALTPLFASVGGYTALEQEAQLKFLSDHVAPVFGPVPYPPYEAFNIPFIPSPVEVSVNLTSKGKPRVRLGTSLGRPLDQSRFQPNVPERDAQVLRGIVEAAGGDLRWTSCLIKDLFLSPSELEAAGARNGPAWPFCLFAFDFAGTQRIMRTYFPGIPRGGRTRTQVLLAAIRNLEPLGSELRPIMDLVEGYLAQNRYDAALHLVGADCLDPAQSRLKVYIDINSNAWNAARDVMTLGGRLADPVSLKAVEILHSIYPLLRDESPDVDNDWHKPPVRPGVSYPGLQISVEVTPRKQIPEIKFYAPLLQWTLGPQKAADNMCAVLRELGHEWGSNGKLEAVMEAVVGEEMVRGLGVITFSYSEKKGAYTSFYLEQPPEYNDQLEHELVTKQYRISNFRNA